MSRPSNFIYTNPYSTQRSTQNVSSTDTMDRNLNPGNNKLAQATHGNHSDQNIHGNDNTNTKNFGSSIEEIIKQLERGGSNSPPQTVVPYLKNLLQISCTSNWNTGQIIRFSEWILNALDFYIAKINNVQNIHNSNTVNLEQEQTQPPVVCIFAQMTLSQLMETHWDDTQIYAALMTCNDEKVSIHHSRSQSQNRNKTLLDILHDVACVANYKEGASTSNCLHAAMVALSTAWKSLRRLNMITSCKSTTMGVRSANAAWWMPDSSDQQNNNNLAETEIPGDRMEQLTHIAIKGLLLTPEEWQKSKMMQNYVQTGIELCEYKTACAGTLIQILENHDMINRHCSYLDAAVIQKEEWITLQKQLLQESIRLNDSNMPVSSFTMWSLTSFELLAIFSEIAIDPYFVSKTNNENLNDSSIGSEFNLRDEYRRIFQSSDILDHIIRAAFWMPGINLADDSPRPKPRWTQQSDSTVIQTSFSVLETLYRTSPVIIGNHIAHHPMVRHFLLMQCNALFQQQPSLNIGSSNGCDRLSQLLFLHKICRSVTRDVLKQVLQQNQQQEETRNSDANGKRNVFDEASMRLNAACRKLLHTLLDKLNRQPRHASAASAGALLKLLLEDGLNPLNNDEISRQLWHGVDNLFVEKCIETLTSTATSATKHQTSASDYYRAFLPCLLDLLYILSKKSSHCGDDNGSLLPISIIISSLSSQDVALLIELMQPKDKRTLPNVEDEADISMLSLLEQSYRSNDSTDSTPAANNLTDNDNTKHINKNSSINLKGMEPVISLAAATLLATLGNSYLQDGTHVNAKGKNNETNFVLAQGRMLDAVNSFISESQLTLCSTATSRLPSLDITRRRVQLLATLGTAENEEYISGIIFSSEVAQMHSINDQARHIITFKTELAEARLREKRLMSEKEDLSEQLRVSTVRYQREKNEIQRTMARNAKQLVEVHASERVKAERRFHDLSKRMSESERLLAEAERSAKESREAEALSRTSLEKMTAHLEEVSVKEKELVKRSEKAEAELFRVKDELMSLKTLMADMRNGEKNLQEQVEKQACTIANAEEENMKLRESLENLFADMCSLAHLYEIKEREASDFQETGEVVVEKLKRKLEIERQRNSELAERQKRIQYENDMLSKKYAKVREKLEDEREDRRKENERRKRMAPVSYINQLHLNQSSANGAGESQRRLKSSLKKQSSSCRSSETDKENSASNDSQVKLRTSKSRY